MKIKDIKIGAVYALRQPNGGKASLPIRAEVLEILPGKVRFVSTGWHDSSRRSEPREAVSGAFLAPWLDYIKSEEFSKLGHGLGADAIGEMILKEERRAREADDKRAAAEAPTLSGEALPVAVAMVLRSLSSATSIGKRAALSQTYQFLATEAIEGTVNGQKLTRKEATILSRKLRAEGIEAPAAVVSVYDAKRAAREESRKAEAEEAERRKGMEDGANLIIGRLTALLGTTDARYAGDGRISIDASELGILVFDSEQWRKSLKNR